LDEKRNYAVLRAANSDGGQTMLSKNHKLKVGEQGIVGYVTSTGKPRIVFDVGEDVNFFRNPHLPLTRSEMALPLISRGAMLGALDVQSEEAAAFSEEDITSLQLLADQVALAINNAHLFEQMQIVLVELEERVSDRTKELRERNSQVENAYEALQDNQQRLLIAEKMASLGRLTAGIAHEMNTPLAAVRASLVEIKALIDEYQASIIDESVSIEDHKEIISEMMESFHIANSSAERASGFVGSIKSQSRNLVPEDKQIFNVVPVINEALLLLNHELRRKNFETSFES
jgi:GAF domain-containing protein